MRRTAPVQPGSLLPRCAGALGVSMALHALAAPGAQALSRDTDPLPPPAPAAMRLAAGPSQSTGTGSSILAPLLAPLYYKTSELDVRPGIMTRVEPEYPESAARRFLSGKVQIRLFINASGTVDRVAIVSAEPPGFFEQSAESAFRAARFSPGSKNGKAVRTQLTLEVSYDSPPAPSPQFKK